ACLQQLWIDKFLQYVKTLPAAVQLKRLLDSLYQYSSVQRLQKILEHSELQRLLGIFEFRESRNNDHNRQLPAHCHQLLKHLQTVDIRHSDIRNQDMCRILIYKFKCFLSACCAFN